VVSEATVSAESVEPVTTATVGFTNSYQDDEQDRESSEVRELHVES